MAERRMIAKTIIDSDLFLDMPMSTQCLYFHLNMRADDDGFINNPKKIQRMIGCNDDDIKLLIAKNFIIPFESGVVVIKHWKIHNYIRMDRYKETLYKEEKSQLVTDKSKEYILGRPDDIPLVDQRLTQDRLGKDRLGKDRESKAQAPALPLDKYGQYGWVKLSKEQYSSLVKDFGEAETKRCIAYVDESAQATGNKNKWKDWNLVVRKCHRQNWGLDKKQTDVKQAADYESGADFLEG